ncbi:nuclear transport factor 2 family protein [Pseudomonas oryzihabitans]|uniref:Ketosteroid isomerase-like protein n=1 Tax=Pseudomonas oryzihabitans TaxID=47885 RepID=A0AAJ2EWV6_9PSED|nr:nuclear transport factor 2 family protein [Pseudomonas psychrotolerans]MDR6235183.1 ketosteroid isomerase-like protein [Pseudomonas psychrotolerans]MDR6355595.1 ketosteroid isomerase-like protein [Pseudomonas psychrotolerans]
MNRAERLGWAATLSLVALFDTPGNAGASESATERNRQLIERAFADWTRGHGRFFDDVLSPEVVWTIQGSGPAARVYHGRQDFLQQAVQPFAQRLAAPLVPRVQAIWAQGDTVVVRWNGTATALDGAPYRNEYVWIFEVHEDRATRVEAFLDLRPYQDVIDRIPLAAVNASPPATPRKR